MAWQQVYQFNLVYSDNPVAIPYQFATDEIIVQIISTRLDDISYHKAGLLWAVSSVPNVGMTKSRPIKVYIARQKVDIPRVQGRDYSLEFLPFNWVTDVTLTFWEDVADRYILGSNPPPTASTDSNSTNTNQKNDYLSVRSAGFF